MESKYTVKIYTIEKPYRVPKELKETLKGVVSGKKLKRMKLEEVNCPVLQKNVPFLNCFVCPNHIRRVTGEVNCTGEPLQ